MNAPDFWRGLVIDTPVIRHHRDLGNIAYWPVRGPDAPTRVGFVDDILLARDLGYTRMKFRSAFAGPTILPGGLTYFIEGAQDRVVYATHVFERETVAATHCVEPMEAGLWRQGTPIRVGMLPLALRVPSLRSRRKDRADAEWGHIRRLLARSGLPAWRGALRELLAAPRVQLNLPTLLWPDTLPDQRGVVVTINSQVVGVEIAPSARQFRCWWNDFGLNESYAIDVVRLLKAPPIILATGGLSLAAYLFNATLRTYKVNAHVYDVELGGLSGQAVFMNGHLLYASLVGERL